MKCLWNAHGNPYIHQNIRMVIHGAWIWHGNRDIYACFLLIDNSALILHGTIQSEISRVLSSTFCILFDLITARWGFGRWGGVLSAVARSTHRKGKCSSPRPQNSMCSRPLAKLLCVYIENALLIVSAEVDNLEKWQWKVVENIRLKVSRLCHHYSWVHKGPCVFTELLFCN